MPKLLKGDIVILPFPFTDKTQYKKRPALILSSPDPDGDLISCEITSKNKADGFCLPIDSSDYLQGNLRMKSFIRPNKLFTVNENFIINKIASLKSDKSNEVIDKIINHLNT